MRTLCLIAFGVAAFSWTAIAEAAPVRAIIDPTASSLSWVGKKVTGQHDGTVALKEGEAVIENGKLVGGSFEIDMSSISVKDISDPTDNQKLAGHLKSDDFFGTNLFPASTFTITKAEPIVGAAPGKANYTITGDLTIKGISNSLTFPAIVSVSDDSATAAATITVDRTKYNVRYGSGRFFDNLGNKLIYDEFEVTLDLKAKVQA
jgi:polyisoprenoid-binding protein YceI